MHRKQYIKWKFSMNIKTLFEKYFSFDYHSSPFNHPFSNFALSEWTYHLNLDSKKTKIVSILQVV